MFIFFFFFFETFQVGQRCEVISVHHEVFNHLIGTKVIIARVSPEFRSAWTYEDKPVTYRTNRKGEKVIDYDPKCIQTPYSWDELRIIREEE